MSDLAAALREAGHEDVAAALDSNARSWRAGCARTAAMTWPTRSRPVNQHRPPKRRSRAPSRRRTKGSPGRCVMLRADG